MKNTARNSMWYTAISKFYGNRKIERAETSYPCAPNQTCSTCLHFSPDCPDFPWAVEIFSRATHLWIAKRTNINKTVHYYVTLVQQMQTPKGRATIYLGCQNIRFIPRPRITESGVQTGLYFALRSLSVEFSQQTPSFMHSTSLKFAQCAQTQHKFVQLN